MKTLLLAAIGLVVLIGSAHAGPAASLANLDEALGGTATIQVDWQDPAMLPRRFRNHCVADPRSGRTDEAFGEDPYLVAQMAGAFVDG